MVRPPRPVLHPLPRRLGMRPVQQQAELFRGLTSHRRTLDTQGLHRACAHGCRREAGDAGVTNLM